MKLKDMLIINAFFLMVAFCLSTTIGFGGLLNTLLILLIPQLINLVPFFWYCSLRRVFAVAGDSAGLDLNFKPVTVLITMLFSIMAFTFFYFQYLNPAGDDFLDRILRVSMVITNSMGLSTAALTTISVYSMFVRIIGKGYRKLLK